MVTHASVSTASVGSGRLHDVRLDLFQDDDLELPDGSLAYPRLVSAVAPATPPASSLGSSDGSPPRVKQPGPDTRTGFSAVELLNTPPNSAELETEILDLRPLDTGATCETFIGYWSNAGVDVCDQGDSQGDSRPRTRRSPSLQRYQRLQGVVSPCTSLYRSLQVRTQCRRRPSRHCD